MSSWWVAAVVWLGACSFDASGPGTNQIDGGPLVIDASVDAFAQPDARSLCADLVSCPHMVVTKSIGTNSRDFATIGEWETTRQGNLPVRAILRVTGGSGIFSGNVTGQTSGCTGIYTAEDDAITNGDTMTLEQLDKLCDPGETLMDSGGATATYVGVIARGTSEKGEAYSDSVFTENVNIFGATFSQSNIMWLSVAPGHRHDGTPGSGVVLQPANAGHAIQIGSGSSIVEWFEITGWSGDSNDAVNITGDEVLVQNLLVHDNSPGTNTDANGITLEASQTATVRNCIVYNIARNGISIHNTDNATLFVDNCTVAGCVRNDDNPAMYGCIGITASSPGSVIRVRNSIAVLAQNGGFDFISPSWEAGTSNNLSTDATAPGTSSLASQTIGGQFDKPPPSDSVDLHLRPGSTAIGAGINLSAEFTDDIDGAVRPAEPAPWDIGADQR